MATTPPPTPTQPVWNPDIYNLFTNPTWTDADTAAGWKIAMLQYGSNVTPYAASPTRLDITNYDHVKSQAFTIYQHLATQSMPVTSNPGDYWPTWALKMFMSWMNQGYRQTQTDPVINKIVIKNAVVPPKRLGGGPPITRLRKDIRNLTDSEVQQYRSKLLNILHVDQVMIDGEPTMAQQLGALRKLSCMSANS
jgi:tyrosinase